MLLYRGLGFRTMFSEYMQFSKYTSSPISQLETIFFIWHGILHAVEQGLFTAYGTFDKLITPGFWNSSDKNYASLHNTLR